MQKRSPREIKNPACRANCIYAIRSSHHHPNNCKPNLSPHDGAGFVDRELNISDVDSDITLFHENETTSLETKNGALWRTKSATFEVESQILASSDSKIPFSRCILSVLQDSGLRPIMEQMYSLFHAQTHANLRNLRFMSFEHNCNTVYQELNIDDNQIEEQKLLQSLRQSLDDSGFELLSQRDLDLCEALNAGYLLRLSLSPDLKNLDPSLGQIFYPEIFESSNTSLSATTLNTRNVASLPFDGRVLVFRRGYSSEVTRGRLLMAKFDYLETSLVQRIAAWLTRCLAHLEIDMNKKFEVIKCNILDVIRRKRNGVGYFIGETPYLQLRDGIEASDMLASKARTSKSSNEDKRFTLERYGGDPFRGSLSPDIALAPFLAMEKKSKGLKNCTETNFFNCAYDVQRDLSNADFAKVKTPQRLLKRISISDLVDVFSKGGRRRLVRSFFSKSTLVEPTYDEVVIVYRPKKKKKTERYFWRQNKRFRQVDQFFGIENDSKGHEPKSHELPIEIRAFHAVPLANILAVMPSTRLIFRPADAFLIDLVSFTSFVAVLISSRFNSPKLDLFAVVSVSLWILRTFFRYSNKLTRYDLTVKTFLTTKIAHKNLGAVTYVADEGCRQRALSECLVYSMLLQKMKGRQTSITRSQIISEILADFKGLFNADGTVHIAKSINDLSELGLIEFSTDDTLHDVKDQVAANQLLRKAWAETFEKEHGSASDFST